MTNPPMNWGYPRTWDGFIHAFTARPVPEDQSDGSFPGSPFVLNANWICLDGGDRRSAILA